MTRRAELPGSTDFLGAEMKDPIQTTAHEVNHDEDEEERFEYPDAAANTVEESTEEEEEFTYPAEEMETHVTQLESPASSLSPSIPDDNKSEERDSNTTDTTIPAELYPL